MSRTETRVPQAVRFNRTPAWVRSGWESPDTDAIRPLCPHPPAAQAQVRALTARRSHEATPAMPRPPANSNGVNSSVRWSTQSN